MPKAKKAQEQIEIEPGADKRLASILKKALNTPPVHRSTSPNKSEPKGGRKGRSKMP